jgi:hypothetical protein
MLLNYGDAVTVIHLASPGLRNPISSSGGLAKASSAVLVAKSADCDSPRELLSASTLPVRFLPSLREAVGRGWGWGVAPRVLLPMSMPKRPPPPTPPRHALRARREGRRSSSSGGLALA